MGLSLTYACAPGFVFCDPARTMVLSLTCAPGRATPFGRHGVRSIGLWKRKVACIGCHAYGGPYGQTAYEEVKGLSRRILPDLSSRFRVKTGLFLVYSTIAEIRVVGSWGDPLWWGDPGDVVGTLNPKPRCVVGRPGKDAKRPKGQIDGPETARFLRKTAFSWSTAQ